MTDVAHASSPLTEQMNYAKALAASDLLPPSYRGKPANVLIALELGNALGLAPTTALYGINVINSKPTLGAETMRAVVLSKGHRFDVIEFTAESATVAVARKERPDDVSTFAFTIDDAKAAGLTNDTYRKFPKAMLLARATSQACRAIFPDVLAGVSYTPEEISLVDRIIDAEPKPEPPVDAWHTVGHDEPDGPDVIVDAEIVEPAPVGRVEQARREAGTYPTPSGRKSKGDQPATAKQIAAITRLAREYAEQDLQPFLAGPGATILDGVILRPDELTNAHVDVLFAAFDAYRRETA